MKKPLTDAAYDPLKALIHPLFVGSLIVLVVNDHLLKGAGLLPSAITGKLSDLAGLMVAPAVLAALLQARSRGRWIATHLVVGVGFASINISPAVARAIEAATAATPFPWQITTDPTDLWALPVLLLSAWSLRRPYWRLEGRRDMGLAVFQGAALLAGALACMATSPPNCDAGDPECQPYQQASLVIGNDTDTERLLRVRPLREDVEVDCDVMLADPTASLSRDFFAEAETWLLEPGRALPLQNDGCDVYLVDGQGLEPTLVAWSEDDYPTKSLSTSVAGVEEGRLIGLYSTDGDLWLGGHPAVYDAPPITPPAPAPGCDVPAQTIGVDWSTTVVGIETIDAITTAEDGCHLLELGGSTMALCLPLETLPFAVGDEVRILFWTPSGSFPELSGEESNATGMEIYSETSLVRAVKGNVIVRASESAYFDAETDFGVDARVVTGCGFHHDECGSYVAPLEIGITGPGIGSVVTLRAGQHSDLSDEAGTLYLVRAQQMPLRDTSCSPYAESQLYFESVLVREISGEGM